VGGLDRIEREVLKRAVLMCFSRYVTDYGLDVRGLNSSCGCQFLKPVTYVGSTCYERDHTEGIT
jgi:hypothetical protein